MDKEIRQFNQARGLPQNYSNSLKWLDIMYPDPVYKRNTETDQNFDTIYNTDKKEKADKVSDNVAAKTNIASKIKDSVSGKTNTASKTTTTDFDQKSENKSKAQNTKDTQTSKFKNTSYNSHLNDSRYTLEIRKVDNPFNKRSIIFHLVFALLATILLGFALIAIFGDYDKFSLGQIIKDIFKASISAVQNLSVNVGLIKFR